jgi:hypothetical protein
VYQKNVFLPAWRQAQLRSRDFSREHENDQPMPGTHEQWVVLWFHDESTFYANDRRKQGWKHKDTTGPLQCLIQRGRVPRKWLQILSVPITDGFDRLMGKKKHTCYSRQGRTEKAILLMKTYLTNIILMMVCDYSF